MSGRLMTAMDKCMDDWKHGWIRMCSSPRSWAGRCSLEIPFQHRLRTALTGLYGSLAGYTLCHGSLGSDCGSDSSTKPCHERFNAKSSKMKRREGGRSKFLSSVAAKGDGGYGFAVIGGARKPFEVTETARHCLLIPRVGGEGGSFTLLCSGSSRTVQ